MVLNKELAAAASPYLQLFLLFHLLSGSPAAENLDRTMGPWAGSLDLGTHRNYPSVTNRRSL
jgi:hypothetical protein